MTVCRRFSLAVPGRFSISKEIQALQLSHAPPLPAHETVDLAALELHGKIPVDISKAPLVMLHGLFGAKQNFASVARKISQTTGHPSIGVDLRNHGSSPHASPHNYTVLANDTIRYLEQHVTQPAVLVGHLMGAKTAMAVSLMRPDLVAKLVVVDNSPVSEALELQFARDLVAMCHVEADRSLWNMAPAAVAHKVDKILARYEHDPLVRVFLLSNLRKKKTRKDHGPIKFRVPVANFLKNDVLSNLGEWPPQLKGQQFHGPVKVMRGVHLRFVRDEHLESAFPEYFTNWSYANFDCGHWVVSEEPERFVAETVAFLLETAHA